VARDVHSFRNKQQRRNVRPCEINKPQHELEITMKTLNQTLAIAGVAVALSLGTGYLPAQERRGDFNPEQFRQRIMERYREQLEVKSDDEWKVIEPRITKVMDARREVGGFGSFGRGGPGGTGGRRGGDGEQGGGDRRREGGDDRRRMFGGEPNPDMEALQKAVESKASADEIKAKLGKYRESRKAKEANVTKAQDELRKVLSVRQEASAVLMGLLQ
jgi:hypothetical protein